MLKNEYGVWLSWIREFWTFLEILELKKSVSMISILVLVAESDFGSTLFGEGSDCIALMAE